MRLNRLVMFLTAALFAMIFAQTAPSSQAQEEFSTRTDYSIISSQPDVVTTSDNLLAVANSCKTTSSNKSSSTNNDKKSTQRFNGNVSWYGTGFNGKKTASGDIFDMSKLMAAHRNLPFGTRVQVEDPKTGAAVIVVVKDRGPFVKTRVMDVSREAGRRLGILLHGVGYMYCLVLED